VSLSLVLLGSVGASCSIPPLVVSGVAVGSEDPNKGYAEKLRDRARERLNDA
jgi:hypothetical protein